MFALSSNSRRLCKAGSGGVMECTPTIFYDFLVLGFGLFNSLSKHLHSLPPPLSLKNSSSTTSPEPPSSFHFLPTPKPTQRYIYIYTYIYICTCISLLVIPFQAFKARKGTSVQILMHPPYHTTITPNPYALTIGPYYTTITPKL